MNAQISLFRGRRKDRLQPSAASLLSSKCTCTGPGLAGASSFWESRLRSVGTRVRVVNNPPLQLLQPLPTAHLKPTPPPSCFITTKWLSLYLQSPLRTSINRFLIHLHQQQFCIDIIRRLLIAAHASGSYAVLPSWDFFSVPFRSCILAS